VNPLSRRGYSVSTLCRWYSLTISTARYTG
jgi:hypothetical protein